MKKTLALLLALTMVLALAACGSTQTTPAAEATEAPVSESPAEVPEESAGSPVNLTFAAQEVGTGPYSLAAALQGVMLRYLPQGSTIDLTTNSPGGVGAPVLIQNQECDIIISNAGPSQWSAEKSAEEYSFGGCPNIASLGGGLGHTFTNIMFTQKFVEKTGYTTLEEVIADKYPIKLITKKNGSLGELTAERVIEACGISVEEFLTFASWEKTGTDAIKSGIQDDLYDATIDHIDAGQATTTEICLTHDMYFVQLTDETLANMQKMGYAPVVMKAGTWNGQETDINSMGSQQNVLVSPEMDEDVAYALIKAMCENVDELATSVASLKYFDPQTAGLKELNGAPLPPGAIRYYQENGLPYDG